MVSDVNAAARLIRVAAENPEKEFDIFLQTVVSQNLCEALLAVDFDFCEYWLEEKKSIALTALFYVSENASAASLAVLRADIFHPCEHKWRKSSKTLADLLNALPVSMLPLNGPMPLRPIAIPKPWGQEIWYTGIEKRGVAEIGGAGRSVPLPWLLAAAPQHLTRGPQQPILLKILDPLPEPVFGDLYFELHRQKQEVYVVTSVDQRAWPDGVGAIRFGFDAKRRSEYTHDADFIRAYLAAVQDYRAVRKRIDAQIDEFRVRDGIDLNAPVSAATLAAWAAEIVPALQESERALRAQMESFTGMLPLQVGDVVKVPCLLPHSLQHGVRTVEFQTPVYERLILSFAQKVLTQSDWDTEEAAGILQLEPEPEPAFPLIAEGDRWQVEQIVQFDDFQVRRIRLDPGGAMRLEHKCAYALGMVVGQTLKLGEHRFDPDEAILLPTGFHPETLRNDSGEVAYFLLALPPD